jgi:hypothetical protein
MNDNKNETRGGLIVLGIIGIFFIIIVNMKNIVGERNETTGVAIFVVACVVIGILIARSH